MAWEDDPALEEDSNVKSRSRNKRPRKFKVLLHNDDYTTMEFVVHILTTHFHKNHAEATQVMLRVHHHGVGVAGIYGKDVAHTKIKQVMAEAKANGMPLKLTMEPE